MAGSKEEIAVAEAYESLHVPALFQQWAPIVLDCANVRSGNRILDVACGTGVLAREAKLRNGDSSSVAGIDAGAGMLAVAERLEPEVAWRQGLAESLPCDAASFDRSMVEADLRGWLPVMGVRLPDELIEDILNDAERVLRDYVTETGNVEFDSAAHIVTAQASASH